MLQLMENLSSVLIRRAEPQDTSLLLQLAADDEIVLPWQDWGRAMADSGVFTYLAEDATAFGFVTAGIDQLSPNEQQGQLIALYIRPSHRRFGMGKKLLVRGLSVLKRRGFESAHIWLGEEAVAALLLITQLGFESESSERWVNLESGDSLIERGYRLNLADYF